MKEIKFRAWDTKHSKLLNVTDLEWSDAINRDFLGMVVGESHGTFHRYTGTPLGDQTHRVEHLTLMQYTGLKDKNGVEIYEGDILELKNNRGSVTGVMKWDNDRNGWLQFSPIDRFEVIGNIWENPELLK